MFLINIYLGKTWEDKIGDLRTELSNRNFNAMVVTALDEIGWLFNLRGNDIPYNPFFRSYAIVEMDRAILYLPPEKQLQNVKIHLKSEVHTYYTLFPIDKKL